MCTYINKDKIKLIKYAAGLKIDFIATIEASQYDYNSPIKTLTK